MIKFISYDQFPEDSYIKELVYLEIDGKFRVAYVPRMGKNGHKFWQPLSIGISKNGKKEYFRGVEFDSKFIEKDIETLLDSEPWNSKAPSHNQKQAYQKQPESSYTQSSFLEECPF